MEKTDSRKIVEETFADKYKKQPMIAFTPYRVCPIGAHADHNLGKITGFAIDKGIYMAYAPKHNGVIEISSLQFEKRAQWHILSTPQEKQRDWADHLRGVTYILSEKYTLSVGLCGVINGELPIGGLSSSAAVIITFISAICKVNNIILTPEEMINIAQAAENKYIGVSCGRLDQSCEVYCRKNNLLYMDMSDGRYELIPAKPEMKPYKIAIFFSGLERSLVGSKYNMRVDELRAAAYAIKAFANMPYGKIQETNMREVPFETYAEYKDRLPETWVKRAEHWYSEYFRVEKGVNAWGKGDIDEFGRLCFESGKSSIDNWETGSPELIELYNIMRKTDGIYGGRFSGAGFKGCCMAIIDPSFEETILHKVRKEYLKAFPDLKDKYQACICESADGVKI